MSLGILFNVYAAIVLGGLTLRGIELAAGQWALRVAMRRAFKAQTEAMDKLQVKERIEFEKHRAERAQRFGKMGAN